MDWTVIVMQLFTGLSLGMLYVMLALGLSIIFGLLTVVNFAHGAMYMWGAYAGVSIVAITGNFWLALITVPLVIGGYGLIVERGLIRPLYGRDINYPLLLTFGLQFIMIEIVRIFWGTSDQPFSSPDLLSAPIEMFGVFYFPSYRLFVIVVTIVICAVLWFFLEKTNLGLVIRAGTRDSNLVAGFWDRFSTGGYCRHPGISDSKRIPGDGDCHVGGVFCCGCCRGNGES